MGAFIYRNTVNNRIVELENECDRERKKEILGTLCCVALVAVAILGLVIRTGAL